MLRNAQHSVKPHATYVQADVTDALMAQFGQANSSNSWHIDESVDEAGFSLGNSISLDSVRSACVYDTLEGVLQMMMSAHEKGDDP